MQVPKSFLSTLNRIITRRVNLILPVIVQVVVEASYPIPESSYVPFSGMQNSRGRYPVSEIRYSPTPGEQVKKGN